MKQFTKFFLAGLVGILLVQACGPTEQELQQREQARLDSLERVRVMQLDQARADSLAMVQRQAQMEEQRIQEEEERAVQFVRNGAFTVQVGSWRSRVTADAQLAHWKSRGYEHAYVVQYGDEEVGDIWFRVRLGQVADRDEAEKLQQEVMREHRADSWISQLR
ncbi:MAG: SPOR domain-containing protein [Balneolales bacterium]|nr:SPOR domain-containing protein [Balneolales bacterium]